MILSDKSISELAINEAMIAPFHAEQASDGAISWGLSSCGYDVTASKEFKLFSPAYPDEIIDVKHVDPRDWLEMFLFSDDDGDYVVAPPHSFVLAGTIEYLRIPRDVVGLMTVKSTYARVGLHQPPTVLEPGWEGNITIEIVNHLPSPVTIYANEGIAQVLFFPLDDDCKVSYADRKGKYQGQRGITLPIVK